MALTTDELKYYRRYLADPESATQFEVLLIKELDQSALEIPKETPKKIHGDFTQE